MCLQILFQLTKKRMGELKNVSWLQLELIAITLILITPTILTQHVENLQEKDISEWVWAAPTDTPLEGEEGHTHTRAEELTNVIIEFKGGNCDVIKTYKRDLIHYTYGATRGDRIDRFVSLLQKHTQLIQRDVIKILNTQKLKYISLWIENEIYVEEMPTWLSHLITQRYGDKVKGIRDEVVLYPWPLPDGDPYEPSADPPWYFQNISRDCSETECKGDGSVVAVLDSGVMLDHPELTGSYRNDEYSWLNLYNDGNSPWDDYGRGTQAAGIAVGKLVGIAPKAKWMACRTLPPFGAIEHFIKMCGQWALCPSLYDARNGKEIPGSRRCDKAPEIILFGGTFDYYDETFSLLPLNFLYKTIQAWNAVDIFSTFQAGDFGPFCTSLVVPARYRVSLAVGSVFPNATVQYEASRGPALDLEFEPEVEKCDLEDRSCKRHCAVMSGVNYRPPLGEQVCSLVKPDLTAPGVGIPAPTLDPDQPYKLVTGSGYANAVVAGVAALMVCANMEARHGPLERETAIQILRKTASTEEINLGEENVGGILANFTRLSNELCNVKFGMICNTFPNNIYGSGIVNACGAAKAIKAGTAGWAPSTGY